MKVMTKVGEMEIPEKVSQRAKFWAEALQDRVRIEEVYGLVEKMLREAYEAGKMEALNDYMGWISRKVGEVVDVEFEVVEEQGLESRGSEHPEPIAISQADGSAEYPMAGGSLPGGTEESTRS